MSLIRATQEQLPRNKKTVLASESFGLTPFAFPLRAWERGNVRNHIRDFVLTFSQLKADCSQLFFLLPKNMVRQELQNKELFEIYSDIKLDSTSLYIVYPTRSGQPAKVKAFVEALIEWGVNISS